MDRQETQALWLCAITHIPRAVCSQTSTCVSALILATLSKSCQRAHIQQLKFVHYLHTELKSPEALLGRYLTYLTRLPSKAIKNKKATQRIIY